MKRVQKASLLSLLTLCLLLVMPMTAQAGFRRQENGKYRYYTSKKSFIKNKFKNIRSKGKTYTYYFDADGYMVTGWQRIKKSASVNWYYFDRNGRMWKNRSKNGHYLQKNGKMLVNDWHGGVYYGEDGSAVPGYRKDVKNGFVKKKKTVKYRKQNGEFAKKEWLCIRDSEGKYYWYYFYSSGRMAQNTWVGSRHVDKNGRMDKQKK